MGSVEEEGLVDAEHPVHVIPDAKPGFSGLEDVRHVYVHPQNVHMAMREMSTRHMELYAELHIDPECPPEFIYWCVEPLEAPT